MWVFCSKEEVAEYTGLSKSIMKDSWSEMVESMIDEHTNRRFSESQAYTEVYDGDGTDTLHLKYKPVLSVTSVSVDGVDLGSSEYKVYSEGYIRLVGSTGTPIENSLGTFDAAFPVGTKNITVVYNAGSASVPGNAKLAAILMVAELALIRERAGGDSSLSVSRASQRAGESDKAFFSYDISGRLRRIMRNTIGHRWEFK